jgi:hypothetical protein
MLAQQLAQLLLVGQRPILGELENRLLAQQLGHTE